MKRQRIYCSNSKIKVKGVSRRKKKTRNPTKSTRPKNPNPTGHKLTVFYKGISVISTFEFVGPGSEKKAKAFIKSKKEDTSIARIKLEQI